MSKSDAIVCTTTGCENAAAVPEDRDHRPLWMAGWRWIGSQNLYSCPTCPPLLIEEDGAHVAGPVLSRRQPA
ncbi:hypothetical protein [Kitasatospora sp. NPDC087315]|uniref:hypothetical protein n=1 Tax=Kitasatospora sp. NPDC087315 TaxID=3364069 RepID=UPI003819F278